MWTNPALPPLDPARFSEGGRVWLGSIPRPDLHDDLRLAISARLTGGEPVEDLREALEESARETAAALLGPDVLEDAGLAEEFEAVFVAFLGDLVKVVAEDELPRWYRAPVN